MESPTENPPERLLVLQIHEPLPGRVLPQMAEKHGHEEAARRYRAIAITTMRQLRGLSDTRIRVLADPADADQAIRFWLLPRLADRWQAVDTCFRSDGWEIDFGGNSRGYRIEAYGEILCPFLGARWVHTALLGLEHGTHRVIGPANDEGEYFRAHRAGSHHLPEKRYLPELTVIRNDEQWRLALESPLGPALKKAWEED